MNEYECGCFIFVQVGYAIKDLSDGDERLFLSEPKTSFLLYLAGLLRSALFFAAQVICVGFLNARRARQQVLQLHL